MAGSGGPSETPVVSRLKQRIAGSGFSGRLMDKDHKAEAEILSRLRFQTMSLQASSHLPNAQYGLKV